MKGTIKSMAENKKRIGTDNPRVENFRIVVYLIVVFGLAWAIEIACIVSINNINVEMITLIFSLINFIFLIPAIGTLVARFSSGEGMAHSGVKFNVSQYKFSYLLSWFGMTILVLLGAVLYFVIFSDNFDADMANYVRRMRDSGITTDSAEIINTFRKDLVISIFNAPLLDLINCAGEEWGWRGYLLPKLNRKFGKVKAVLLTGLINGIWYAPLIEIGYFYGVEYNELPVKGIISICIFAVVTGCIFSALTLRTGSIIPAVFAHSSLNVFMSKVPNLAADGGNPFVGPAPTGIISGIPIIIVAVVIIVYMVKHPDSADNSPEI